MSAKEIVLLSLLSIGGAAWGQTACPGGVAAGNAQCGPTGGGIDMSPPARQPQWHYTWGAIAAATDTSGHIGVSVLNTSKRKAKKIAIDRCEASSKTKCELVLAYKNQCAVIASPAEGGKAIGGTPVAQSAVSIEVAAKLGVKACSLKRGGGECVVIYSACAEPYLE